MYTEEEPRWERRRCQDAFLVEEITKKIQLSVGSVALASRFLLPPQISPSTMSKPSATTASLAASYLVLTPSKMSVAGILPPELQQDYGSLDEVPMDEIINYAYGRLRRVINFLTFPSCGIGWWPSSPMLPFGPSWPSM